MPITLKSLSLNLPFGIGGVTVDVTQADKQAAWKLFVELSTRVATQPLEPNTGFVREALSSLYNLFDITRSILKDAGPEVGRNENAFGWIAMRILNEGLRPFLTRWHASYARFEAEEWKALEVETALSDLPVAVIDQTRWPQVDEFYEELEEKRLGLLEYRNAVAKVAQVR